MAERPTTAAFLASCAVCGPLSERTRLYVIGTYLVHEVPTGYANPTTPADEVEPCGPVRKERLMSERNQVVCVCGKPSEHVNADEESADWPCRVPDTYAARQRVIAAEKAGDTEAAARALFDCL